MKYTTAIHHRRRDAQLCVSTIGYDYSLAGMYFVTICVQKHTCLFGEIVDGEMVLNDYGKIIQTVWDKLPQHYDNIQLDEFVIMPNHIHGIIVITGDAATVGAGFKPAPTITATPTKHGLPEIVRALKTFSARKINELRNLQGEKLWQRNYWEHIIRNEQSYQRIANYIINNPQNWNNDEFYLE